MCNSGSEPLVVDSFFSLSIELLQGKHLAAQSLIIEGCHSNMGILKARESKQLEKVHAVFVLYSEMNFHIAASLME